MRTRLAPLVLVLALVGVACGDASPATTPTPPATSSPDTSTGTPTALPTEPASTATADAASACDALDTFLVDEVNAYEQADGIPNPELAVTCDADGITVTSNNIPNFEFVRITPNELEAQALTLTIPTEPVERDRPGAMSLGVVGVSVGGLQLFGAFEAPNDGYGDPVSDGLLDSCNGHTAQGGVYHHHARMDCVFSADPGEGVVVGWLADGYPILTPFGCADSTCSTWEPVTSSYVRVDPNSTGAFDAWEYQPGAGDLDECNGRTDPDGRYRYYATDEFPYLPFCFHGETDLAIGDFDGSPPAAGGGGPR